MQTDRNLCPGSKYVQCCTEAYEAPAESEDPEAPDVLKQLYNEKNA